MSLHAICHRCEFVQKPPYSGACACLYEPDKPVDITVRAAAMACPAGKFDANQIELAKMEAAGMTVETARADAKRRSCCDPPSP